MKTGIITTDTYLDHNTGQGHPERADRVSAVIESLKKFKNKNLIWKKPSTFDRKLLEITHNNNYVNQVEKSFPEKGLVFLDGDTIVSPGSKQATLDAVGSIIAAIDGVQSKELQIPIMKRSQMLGELIKIFPLRSTLFLIFCKNCVLRKRSQDQNF